MKKLFIPLFIASFSVLVHSQSLTPLSVWMKQRPNWQDDKSEIAYFTLRCNVFLKFVGVYFITRSDKQAGIDRGKEVDANSDSFSLPALYFGHAAGYKTDDIIARADKISSAYSNQISKNKDLTNSIFDGYVGDDFKICTDAVPNFKILTIEIKKRESIPK
jgi:hypothetical protein